MSWVCPECGGVCGVIDSRTTGQGQRRRRLCKGCGGRFTTIEMRVQEGQRTIDLLGRARQVRREERHAIMLELADFLKAQDVVEESEESRD